MDAQTLDAYARHAADWIARDGDGDSPHQHLFPLAFGHLTPGRGTRILDVGAGRGREVLALQRMGFEAFGLEPSPELRAAARPGLAHPLFPGSLPHALPAGEPFHGLLCSAVLQHLPRGQLFESVLALRDGLAPGGRALVSIPRGPRPDVSPDGRDAWGRLFNGVTADELLLLFERVGFTFLTRMDSEDAWARPGVAWTTLLFERPLLHGTARPIDQLATVLGHRERKVATYKLALLRALNDIAATQPHLARWREDGRVALPANVIAGQWLRYYWSLLDAPRFIPQQQGDLHKQRHTLGFAPQLLALIQSYRRRNGLDGFEFDLAMGQLGDRAPLHAAALRQLKTVIKAGPVTYAGGALEEGRLFGWEKGMVLVPSPLWRELSLLGHWIGDSLVLRWAELIARLSQDTVGVDAALPFLLPRPPLERDTELLRGLYREGPTQCVWSGKRVTAELLAIDHVIPWSLWRNNELWNLVPSHAKVNQAKSDLVPSRKLLRDRKTAIQDSWGVSLEQWPERFRREAARHTASHLNASLVDSLFDALVESVETLRIQRGLPAWEGPGSATA